MSARIVSAIKTSETSCYAVFAAGCFWGVEHIFRKYFKVPTEILDIKVGYANGKSNIINPTYKQVCTGETDFAESVLISFEPDQVSYEKLVEFFFKIHDPTTVNSQGPDIGTQYRSGIYTLDSKQQEIAESVKNSMQINWYKTKHIVTNIETLKNFYDAETYHQMYLNKNVDGYTCPTHYLRENPE